MGYEYTRQEVTDEDRREFLKVLGITGTAAVGGMTVSELRGELSAGSAEELASTGEAIEADLTGSLNADLIATQQAEFVTQASSIPAVIDEGLPTGEPRNDFAAVAEAGQPVYDHLSDVGFFESTTNHMPEFTPESLVASVEQFITSEQLAETLVPVGFDAREMVDLFVAIVDGRHVLSNQLWLATDEIPQEQIRGGEHIAPMTKQAAGGVLLWLNDLDLHLSDQSVLITDEILADATWNAHAMAAGFQMMTEGAKEIAEGSGRLSNSELGSLFATGFSLQTMAQYLLPHDAYWITEEMRAPRRTDLETVTTK